MGAGMGDVAVLRHVLWLGTTTTRVRLVGRYRAHVVRQQRELRVQFRPRLGLLHVRQLSPFL